MTTKKFNEDEKIISKYYKDKIEKFKNGPGIIGWSKDGQVVRFNILNGIGDLSGKTILDVGCGLGDLYGFLTQDKNIKIKRYLGIDTNPEIIDMAKKKYPKAEFEIRDMLKNPIKESFDYVLESGAFGVDTPNWQEMTHKLLIEMFKVCNIGIGANFLSDFIPFKKTKGVHYINPATIIDFSKKRLNSRIILRHDYLPHDFTVFIYKKPFDIF